MTRYSVILRGFVVAFALLLPFGCQEQVNTSSKLQSNRKAPRITFDKLVHDFGDVASKEKYTVGFKFTNNGDDLLKITQVKPCCGVVTHLAKNEFEPGGSGVLNVEYNSGKSSGVVVRQIEVTTNDKSNPKIRLTLKANVVPKIVYKPHRLQLVINKENGGSPMIEIASLENQVFSLRGFLSTGGSITAEIDPSVEATKFVLQPRVDIEKLQERSAGFISIGLTHPECDRIDIYFSTLLRFQITPKSIILFDPEPLKPIVKELSIISNYGEDFDIESTSSEKGIARIISQHRIDKGYKLEVEIAPLAPDDKKVFMDVLNVRLKGGEELAIKCYVRYTSK